MGEYRRRNPYKNLKHYRNSASNYYRRRKPYSIHYHNPIKIKVYYKPNPARRARGRLEYPKPRPENVKPPEKKYESKHRTERTSAPPIPKPLRYTFESQVEPWVDAEEIAKEVEEKLDRKITERILEKFEFELEELMNKIACRLSEKPAETTEEPEEKFEPGKQDLTESGDEKIEGNVQEEVERLETDQELPEPMEETGEDYPSLEGGFSISSTFGLAIPLEDIEIEDGAELPESFENESTHLGESEVEIGKESEAESWVQDQPLEAEESAELITAVGIDETEIKEKILEKQDKLVPEPLPEETELYPVEKTEVI